MKRPNPSELRNTLGANLRDLAQTAPSISALCRDLGINRTQFNRYLAGESFPRPDILFRICQYFHVDARIILEPLSDIGTSSKSILSHPEIIDFLSASVDQLQEGVFPSGFYKFVRRSFLDDSMFVQGLVYVYRKDGTTFVRGYETKKAMLQQGLPDDAISREFRGVLLAQEGGIAGLVSRRNSLSTSFNYLTQVPSFKNNYWVGYAARTVRESMTGSRITRLVYKHLGSYGPEVRKAAHEAGFYSAENLDPYERNQLRIDAPFI